MPIRCRFSIQPSQKRFLKTHGSATIARTNIGSVNANEIASEIDQSNKKPLASSEE